MKSQGKSAAKDSLAIFIAEGIATAISYPYCKRATTCFQAKLQRAVSPRKRIARDQPQTNALVHLGVDNFQAKRRRPKGMGRKGRGQKVSGDVMACCSPFPSTPCCQNLLPSPRPPPPSSLMLLEVGKRGKIGQGGQAPRTKNQLS